ncbi:acyl-CoA carboxylase subunit epsilon [Streptomyces hazeniae]|uniref:acyl-CoA carboxylase subunit epsilon n=1 Tax=Streptomyces hazeniae TaxID=3075538 RepID=UPI00374E0A8C
MTSSSEPPPSLPHASRPPAAPATPTDLMRVVRGRPTAEELAVVAAVLQALRTRRPGSPPGRPSQRPGARAARWTSGGVRAGAGSWSTPEPLARPRSARDPD